MKLHNKPRRDGYFLKGSKLYVYQNTIEHVSGWFIDTPEFRYHVDGNGGVEVISNDIGSFWEQLYQDPDESFDNALAWLAAALLTGAIK